VGDENRQATREEGGHYKSDRSWDVGDENGQATGKKVGSTTQTGIPRCTGRD